MKVTVNNTEINSFPKLMISNDKDAWIGLFNASGEATWLTGHYVGVHAALIDMTNFIDFHGSITLSND